MFFNARHSPMKALSAMRFFSQMFQLETFEMVLLFKRLQLILSVFKLKFDFIKIGDCTVVDDNFLDVTISIEYG